MSHSRFSCLAPPNNSDLSGNTYKAPGRHNRFSKPQKKTNSRWNRSKSPEKNRRFPSPEKRNNFVKSEGNDRREKPKYNRGGFGKFRYNHGRRGPSRFDNVKKDNMGRPMLANAITGGFDIGLALQKSKKNNVKKPKKKVELKKEEPKLVPFKKEKKLTEEQQKAEDDWNRQMILNMQWETDSEEEGEEGEEGEEVDNEE